MPVFSARTWRRSFCVRTLTQGGVGLTLLLSSVAVFAGSNPPLASQDKELIKQLLTRIDQLEGRLAEVEGKQAAAPPPQSAPPANTATASEETHEGSLTDEPMMHGGMLSSSPMLQLRGFGDVQYHTSNRHGDHNAFTLGQLDLFISSRLSDELSVVSEMVVEADENNAFGFDIERLLLQYAPSDLFNIAAGRYHTAIGYYNTAYHHGTWFQTAIGRPFIFAFEDGGGLLPIHNTGVTVSGRIPFWRQLGLRYVAEVGNGRDYTKDHEPVQNVNDNNHGKAVNVALFARPEWLPGLQGGVSLYRDHPTPKGSPKFEQTIGSAHLVYVTPTFEWLNEGVLIHHNPSGSHSTNTTGFYTQLAQQFGLFRPYLRYQYVNAPQSDPLPLFKQVGLRHGPSLGLRYNFSDFLALKLQYDYTIMRKESAFSQFTVQAAFAF